MNGVTSSYVYGVHLRFFFWKYRSTWSSLREVGRIQRRIIWIVGLNENFEKKRS